MKKTWTMELNFRIRRDVFHEWWRLSQNKIHASVTIINESERSLGPYYIVRGQCSRRRHDKDLLMFYDFMSLNDSVSLGEVFLLTSRDFNIEYFVWKYVIICLFTNKFYYEESTAKIKKNHCSKLALLSYSNVLFTSV